MNTKDQAKKYGVCDLELSQEMKKLGFKQEGLFWWTRGVHWTQEIGIPKGKRIWNVQNQRYNDEKAISAFTTAALGESLPFNIKVKNEKTRDLRDIKVYCLQIKKHKDQWGIAYHYVSLVLGKNIYADTLANAMAKMLIYLKKNKLMEAK